MARTAVVARKEYGVREKQPRTETMLWPLRPSDVQVYYPESDGEPMAETDVHIKALIYLREALRDFYRDDPQVYVASNLFLYYEEGDPLSRVAPDVFVVFGVPRRDRRIYRLWAEGKGPDVVIEISSRSTRREDLWEKRGLYEYLGVKEYFLFDPLREYLEPPLQGYRLAGSLYHRLEPEPAGQGEWRLFSQQLGLELCTEGDLLRLYDPQTGEKLLTPLEAQEKARREAQRRRQMEEELARLRAELARLKGQASSTRQPTEVEA